MLVKTLIYDENASPASWGEQHGATFRDEIFDLYRIRLQLMLEKTDLGTEDRVLALADKHLPVLEAFDRDLYDELVGIAKGSDRTPQEILVLNHYTDLRDLGAKALDDDGDPGGCSVVYTPGQKRPVLGQTWDMHGSAADHVGLLSVPLPKGGRALMFTIFGCVGMCGMTSSGLGMTINNLNSLDAKIGVCWPALVRRCLRDDDVHAAKRVIDAAPIGSGHHYVMTDGKAFFGVETSGTEKVLLQEGAERVHLHTNHCLDPGVAKKSKLSPGSTTLERYDTIARATIDDVPKDADAVWTLLQSVSMDIKPDKPHDAATCGALVMDLSQKKALVAMGPIAGRAPFVIDVGASA